MPTTPPAQGECIVHNGLAADGRSANLVETRPILFRGGGKKTCHLREPAIRQRSQMRAQSHAMRRPRTGPRNSGRIGVYRIVPTARSSTSRVAVSSGDDMYIRKNLAGVRDRRPVQIRVRTQVNTQACPPARTKHRDAHAEIDTCKLHRCHMQGRGSIDLGGNCRAYSSSASSICSCEKAKPQAQTTHQMLRPAR
jgi:hypothetical protein